MKKLYLLGIFFFFLPSTLFAEVTQFVFISPPLLVQVGSISKVITIQSQNSAGLAEAVTETTDLLFQTTSPTGKFVASSGKPTSKTMSKNTAKRSFYYIDSTPGTYTLSIKTTGRTTKQSFGLSQKVVVGDKSVIGTEVKNIPVAPKPAAIPGKKDVEGVKPALVKKSVEVASSTKEVKSEAGLAAVIYTATPKTSALESFLWLPRKVWGAIQSVFQ